MYESKISFNKWDLACEIFKFKIKGRIHIWTQDKEGGSHMNMKMCSTWSMQQEYRLHDTARSFSNTKNSWEERYIMS